jgi:hypothetical protein
MKEDVIFQRYFPNYPDAAHPNREYFYNVSILKHNFFHVNIHLIFTDLQYFICCKTRGSD